jgi:hypothetical protein
MTLEPLEAAEEFVFLRHAPCMTLSEKWLIAPRLRATPGSPRALVAWGILSHAQALASAVGQEKA